MEIQVAAEANKLQLFIAAMRGQKMGTGWFQCGQTLGENSLTHMCCHWLVSILKEKERGDFMGSSTKFCSKVYSCSLWQWMLVAVNLVASQLHVLVDSLRRSAKVNFDGGFPTLFCRVVRGLPS
jgi:hypothetical protein